MGQAVALLARAFFDDPGYCYALRDVARRGAQLGVLYEGMMDIAARRGEIDARTDDGALCAVASWMGPGGEPGLWDFVRAGLLELPFRFGARTAARLGRCLLAMERSKAELMRGRPHWYLDQLATDPSRQGQGHGRALLGHGIEARLARQKLPLFLFTANPRNVPFYQGAGFAVIREERVGVPEDGFRLWSMLREP